MFDTTVLRVGVLNDDILYRAFDGYVFKGGYIAQVEYYRYLNEWNDTKHIKKFRSEKQLDKFLKQYDTEIEE